MSFKKISSSLSLLLGILFMLVMMAASPTQAAPTGVPKENQENKAGDVEPQVWPPPWKPPPPPWTPPPWTPPPWTPPPWTPPPWTPPPWTAPPWTPPPWKPRHASLADSSADYSE